MAIILVVDDELGIRALLSEILTDEGYEVDLYSYGVHDLVEVKEKSKQLAIVLEAQGLAERDVPDYIEADHNKMMAKLTRVPSLGEVPFPVHMEPNLVVEYYSR